MGEELKYRMDGDCFEVAYQEARKLEDEGKDNVRIVHAEVSGQDVSPRHAHAWVEYIEHIEIPRMKSIVGDELFISEASTVALERAVDKANGNDVTIPVVMYRRIGDVTNVHEYTVAEAEAKMREYEHYGPWGWKSSTGL